MKRINKKPKRPKKRWEPEGLMSLHPTYPSVHKRSLGRQEELEEILDDMYGMMEDGTLRRYLP